ncbi:Thiol-specific monooxygenase like protein [Verticillium longisporum]|uniref:Thiol-specific monooxygenase like protein n=1 Tax=Verticillium longisporum TaxID=100787 RepID=A0A8I2ZFV7_VERLO|nr:Thiol-specific monooxygenase like protein [Verticillium longisporum]
MRFSAAFWGLCLALLLPVSVADVVVLPGGLPKSHIGRGAVKNADDFFRQSMSNEFYNNSAEVLLSSFNHNVKDSASLSIGDGVRPSADSFVRGAIQAWGEHLHFVVRPEEVWFTILVQMNFYTISHAEDIRDLFVDHEGQETITIEDFTWEQVLIRFQDEIQARVKTDWLQNWITPDFTTTTQDDLMTANILMMGLTKAYFRFEGGIICGLPSVTLQGEKSDWEALLDKLARLPEFGEEATAYAERLRPILKRFIKTFDEPDSSETVQFWNDIVSARSEFFCGAPPFYMSGWITGFYYWNDRGEPYARNSAEGNLVLDGVQYPSLDIGTLPVGYASAPFVMLDYNGTDRFESYVLAGTLGKKITSGPPTGYAKAMERIGSYSSGDTKGHSTLQSLSAWVVIGPKSHDADERPPWQGEVELADLIGSIDSNFEADKCALRGSATMSEVGGRGVGVLPTVAVIGAGPSGAIATDALVKEQAFDTIRVFDRRGAIGGTWVYTPHLPAKIPSLRDLIAGNADHAVPIPAQLPAETSKTERVNNHQTRFSDSALHENLHSNIIPSIMSFTQEPFPDKLSERTLAKYGPRAPFRHREVVREWVQEIFVRNGNDKLLELNTTVERAVKNEQQEWVLTLRKETPGKDYWWEERFDALIVASGHYNVPWIPDIPGIVDFDAKIKQANRRLPGVFQHTFSIDDPSLAFIGMLGGGFTFRVYEWQAVAVARLLAGRARPLPSRSEQLEWEQKRVAELEGGKNYYSIALDYEGFFEYLRYIAGDPTPGTTGRVLPPFDKASLAIWTGMVATKIKGFEEDARKAELEIRSQQEHETQQRLRGIIGNWSPRAKL